MSRVVVPNTGAGFSNPTEDLVGFQSTRGGGLTNTNFKFDTGIVEKINKDYQTGVFSNPITLDTIGVDNIEEARQALAKEIKVYPNFDLTEVTNFTLYGSLSKRLEVSVTQIINFFPAALEIDQVYYDYTTGYTADNIVYNQNEDTTTLTIDVTRIKNIFDIDYTTHAARNISLRPTPVSPLRDLTSNYLKYSLFLGTASTEYQFVYFVPSQTLTAGTIQVTISGNPFSGEVNSTDSIVLKPNKMNTEMVFFNDFDEVEKFLLNRFVVPKYTAQFKVPRQLDDGSYYTAFEYVTWPLFGSWNLDIITDAYQNYVTKVSEIGAEIDDFKTNLISRFLTTGAFHEFDTPDQKVEKVLQIYGRSFDETKKFIDALANMTNVSYLSGDDIPSTLLVYLAKTLGWNTDISPITNDEFLESIYGVKNKSIYEGWTRDQTPTEVNFEYYKKLVLNSAYLFRSKGTRRSVEFLMKTVGAPDSLIEYNETIYIADRPLKYSDFINNYAQISGGTYVQNIPGYLVGSEYKIQGRTFTAFTTNQTTTQSLFRIEDYPIDENGFPKTPEQTNNFFFQEGGGWFEQTPNHNSGQEAIITNQTFTGQSPNSQLQEIPPTYGQLFLNRYRTFPNMNGFGFNITKIKDSIKSETDTDPRYDGDSLMLNVKNIDLFLNVAQGITYDVWEVSRENDYPIPYSGLSAPYPQPGNIDWTVINPEPQVETFAEFAQTFYKNMINVRNRWYTNDGKSSGYPTLQLVFWNYLQSLQNAGIDISHYTYQKMIDYTIGIGDYWTNLVQQTIPSSTIWNGGIKYENSEFHRQKYVYRRQRGCIFVSTPCIPCTVTGPLFSNDCIDETVSGSTIPWSGTSSTLDSFSQALFTVLNQVTNEQGYNLASCDTNTVNSTWYVDLRLDDIILVQEPFYTGYGIYDIPTEQNWIDALDTKLETIYQYGLNYNVNAERIIISNSGCMEMFKNKILTLNVGINATINCE
jgi:hypothetical protein